MAKKVNASKLALESHGQAEVTNRQAARESVFCLMQVRLPKLKIFSFKRKLPVVMDAETRAQIEHPVKIRHVG